MLAAIQALFFSGHRQKNNGGREFHLAQDARTLQAHRRAAAIVVRPRGRVGCVSIVAVSRIVVARDEHDPFGLLRIRPAQNRIDIRDLRGLWNPVGGLSEERIRFPLQTSATVFGIAFELGLDPLARRSDALARFDRIIILCRKRGPGSKTDQFVDRLLEAFCGDLADRSRYLRVRCARGRPALGMTKRVRLHYLQCNQQDCQREPGTLSLRRQERFEHHKNSCASLLTWLAKKLNITRYSDCGGVMVFCPECETDLDIEEDEVDEGEVVSCPECGSDFEVITANPIELKPVDEEEYEDDDEKVEAEADDGDDS